MDISTYICLKSALWQATSEEQESPAQLYLTQVSAGHSTLTPPGWAGRSSFCNTAVISQLSRSVVSDSL